MAKNRDKTEKDKKERPQNKNLKRDAGPGRPKGQRNYATIYRAALIKIADANNKTPEEIEEMMEQAGLKKALAGDFAFQKDIKDRLHGKAQQKTDITSDGKPMQTNGVVFMDFSKPDQGKPEFIDPNNAKS
jgi:hypothetical protein